MSTEQLTELMQEGEEQEAAEPGTFRDALLNLPIPENKVTDAEDQAVPFPMTPHELKSAGWSIVYHRKDRDARLVNNNMRAQVLATKDASEVLVFQANKPTQEPFRGTLRCRLHSDDPKRAEWDELGLPLCSKATMRTPLDVRQHMSHKHKAEWAVIEEIRQRTERQEDRAVQMRILALAGESVRVEQVTDTRPTNYVEVCAVCEHQEEAGIKVAASNKMKKHMRDAHGDND